MSILYKTLHNNPIIYVTRDIERAMGIPFQTPGYFVVTNKTAFAEELTCEKKNVILLAGKKMLDTWELLEKLEKGKGKIIVFKNTPQIEKICQKNNWPLLNPQATLANRVEEKISQIDWLGYWTHYLPRFEITTVREVNWKNEPFILQFNRAHTGTGTVLIQSKKELEDIQNKFPNRAVRLTKYIEGPTFTLNAVVSHDKILVQNISYQITGLSPFTDESFATIGNDWALPIRLLTSEQREEIKKIALSIGEKLRTDGWKGLFGIDVIAEAKTGKLANWQTGKLYLIEINARQTASAVFESKLQSGTLDNLTIRQFGSSSVPQLSSFEAHLMALLDLPLSEQTLIPINTGAQIVLRVKKNEPKIMNQEKIRKNLETQGFTVIPYANTKPGSDLLRIQSAQGLMADQAELNARGKQIKECLDKLE